MFRAITLLSFFIPALLFAQPKVKKEIERHYKPLDSLGTIKGPLTDDWYIYEAIEVNSYNKRGTRIRERDYNDKNRLVEKAKYCCDSTGGLIYKERDLDRRDGFYASRTHRDEAGHPKEEISRINFFYCIRQKYFYNTVGKQTHSITWINGTISELDTFSYDLSGFVLAELDYMYGKDGTRNLYMKTTYYTNGKTRSLCFFHEGFRDDSIVYAWNEHDDCISRLYYSSYNLLFKTERKDFTYDAFGNEIRAVEFENGKAVLITEWEITYW